MRIFLFQSDNVCMCEYACVPYALVFHVSYQSVCLRAGERGISETLILCMRVCISVFVRPQVCVQPCLRGHVIMCY